MMVTGNYFNVLGVRPALGRFFEANEQDDAPNAHSVAVLGHAIWQPASMPPRPWSAAPCC
jgi:hypothetical protein